MIAPKLSQLILIQLSIALILSVGAMLFCSLYLGASIATGAAVILTNLLFLIWAWKRIFAKKSIAWTLLIIVIKYAVLLGSIFFLAREPWFSSLGAGLGISSFVLAALIMALIFRKDIA